MLSLKNRFYYSLKPYVARGLRLRLRRIVARRLRRRHADTWPIDPAAAHPPEGWPGWPEGKQFAFVLTHDVEGPEGVAKVRALANLEMECGFRSSFNFIPEGPYRVPDELRDWLTRNGFEVGVHDLNHDGLLLSSRAAFQGKAQRINRYLRDWGASGFRAGFMFRNLEWYHDLEVSYDASTFDTDPFEPQRGDARTIFPFWVAAKQINHSGKNGRRGYVELPYSLAQDSTLFLILQETTPAIWLQKLDWVAQQGGMALVNVHPDYVCFKGQPQEFATFPAEHYRALLRYVLERHQNRCWHKLPREIAAFAATLPNRAS